MADNSQTVTFERTERVILASSAVLRKSALSAWAQEGWAGFSPLDEVVEGRIDLQGKHEKTKWEAVSADPPFVPEAGVDRIHLHDASSEQLGALALKAFLLGMADGGINASPKNRESVMHAIAAGYYRHGSIHLRKFRQVYGTGYELGISRRPQTMNTAAHAGQQPSSDGDTNATST